MATTSSRKDPFTSFNFIVDVQGMRAGFSEVSGLPNENNIVEYRESNQDIMVRKLPGQRKHTNISFKRGYTNSKDLWEWRKKVIDGKAQRLSGTITVLDEARKPALVWKFSNGWPSKWAGPAFNAKSNDVTIEEMEIAIEGLELE